MNLEEYLDEEFRLLGVTPHITHLKLLQESYYRVITVATPHHVPYLDSVKLLGVFFSVARNEKRSDLGAFLIGAYAKRSCGVALCHHLDQFDRKRGRIIAKGRLFKLLRQERL